MTGGQCHGSLTTLYDIAGQIRAAFMELQRQVRLSEGTIDAQGR
jgi:hypothetical protein